MATLETAILRPDSEQAIVDAVTQMCTDLCVGGIALTSELVETTSDGLHELLAEGIPGDYIAGTQSGIHYFDRNHEWHLPVECVPPKLRLWYHIRGSVQFSIARAVPGGSSGYFGSDTQGVQEISYANPAVYVPNVNDMLIFVDHGTPGVTGTSSVHRTDVNHTDPRRQRLSLVRDFGFNLR